MLITHKKDLNYEQRKFSSVRGIYRLSRIFIIQMYTPYMFSMSREKNGINIIFKDTHGVGAFLGGL